MAQCYGSQELLPLVLLTKPPWRPERTMEIVQRRDTGSNRGVAGHPQGQKERWKAKKRGRGKRRNPAQSLPLFWRQLGLCIHPGA